MTHTIENRNDRLQNIKNTIFCKQKKHVRNEEKIHIHLHIENTATPFQLLLRGGKGLESAGKMTQLERLRLDAITSQSGRLLSNSKHHFDDVVDVRLGVGSARNRQAHQVHGCRHLGPVRLSAKHDSADLASADSTGTIELDGQRLTRILQRRDVRQHSASIDVHSVAAHGLNDRNAGGDQSLAQVSSRLDAILQVVVVDTFGQANCQSL